MPFETKVLKALNFKIEKGEFIGIIGHTGCGKTTLIQLMNGLLEPTVGKVFIDGVDIMSNRSNLKRIRKKIGLSFQYPEHQLFEENVFREVAFGPKNMGIEKDTLEKTVKQALKMVSINYQDYKARSPFNLSGGEMRRIAIASVLSFDPDVLILDEPTASLDPLSRKNMLNLVGELHNKYGKTIIMVSHNMEAIAELTERVLVMEKGKIVLDGNTRDIFCHHYQKLENIGLTIPQVTKIMKRMKEKGKNVNSDVLTVKEAMQEIIKLKIEKKR